MTIDRIHLESAIENLRQRLLQVAHQKGNLLDPDVIALSQELDQYIVKLQLLKHEKTPARR